MQWLPATLVWPVFFRTASYVVQGAFQGLFAKHNPFSAQLWVRLVLNASNFSLQSHWTADLQPAIGQIKPVSFVSPKYKFYFMITTLIHSVFMTFFNTSCRSWYADSTKCGSSDCAESYFTTPDLTALEMDFVTTITHIFFLRGGVPKLYIFFFLDLAELFGKGSADVSKI